MTAAIEARGLARDFGRVKAVDGVTLAIQPGEVFGLVGPDGAGKTTLLRLLAGLLTPTRGSAAILGTPVVAGADTSVGALGYMSQRFGLYADLTVDENMRFYADMQGVPQASLAARTERLLAFSGLLAFRARRAGQLSGGMKQKLGLACALLHEPRVLLLDEPTNGVDPISRRDFWRILRDLVKERGTTIFVSTAYLDEAERCDRLALMYAGRLLAVDTPDHVKALVPGTLYAWTPAAPRAAADLLRPHFSSGAVALYGDRVQVFGRTPAELALARELLAKLGCVAPPEVRAPSLEDVFVAILSERADAG